MSHQRVIAADHELQGRQPPTTLDHDDILAGVPDPLSELRLQQTGRAAALSELCSEPSSRRTGRKEQDVPRRSHCCMVRPTGTEYDERNKVCSLPDCRMTEHHRQVGLTGEDANAIPQRVPLAGQPPKDSACLPSREPEFASRQR